MNASNARCIAFDMEGPLTPIDAALELMARIPNGRRLFAAISRYDDLLALSGRPDYEPGDTLALILPFLLAHGLGMVEIEALAQTAAVTNGAGELLADLSARQYHIFCLTTAYEPFARPIAHQLGIRSENLACTPFPVADPQVLSPQQRWRVTEVERRLAALEPYNDEALSSLLDTFYWGELPGTPLGQAVATLRPIGGRRKLAALQSLAAPLLPDLSQWVVVGDSITDNAMLSRVRDCGGLAVAFNGNRYALECATVGVASTSLADIGPLLRAWEEGGLSAVWEFIDKAAKDPQAPPPHYHWLAGEKDMANALASHGHYRRLLREQAAHLG